MRRLILVAALVAVPGVLCAQRGSFSPHFSAHFTGFHSGSSRGRFSGYGYYPLGFLDPLESEELAYSGPEPGPPVVIVQPAAAPLPAPSHPQMIELQGDRYVQVSGEGNVPVQDIDANPLRPVPAAPRESPVALLVFRDGRREQISGYTIAGGVLYASADYYSEGAWNRKIELSQLNVSETVRANRSNGLEFRLPAAPNEVIVGP